MNQHCQVAKDHIAVAEAGDSKMAAYRRAAEEIEKAINEDDLTYRQVAEQIGKDPKYVTRLLKALWRTRHTKSDFYVDWESGSNKREEIAVTVPRKVDDQVRMATELLARPGVADAVVASTSAASSAVQRAVSRKVSSDYEVRTQVVQEDRRLGLMSVRGYLARIAGKVQEFAGELVAIEPDLVEARDAFAAHTLALALRDLGNQCHRIADRIDQDTEELGVIEASTRL